MASSRNGSAHPILSILGAILIAVFGIGLCTGNKGKDTPEPTPSMSTQSNYPPVIEPQP